ENGIDLGALSPSGPHGRIVAEDVAAAIAHKAPAHAAPALARGASANRVKALYEPGSYEEVPLDGMRKTIAARLMEAKQTIPHFYLTADVMLERVLAVRSEASTLVGADGGKPSINDFV